MMQPTILVVEALDDDRRRISAWLEDAGYDEVMCCPGPGGPDYTCLGGLGKSCPLSKEADVVVIDLHLRSDEMLAGTPGWQLMLHYYEQGKKIVALSGVEDAVHPLSEDQVRVIARPIQQEAFLAAVGSLARPDVLHVESTVV